MLGFFLLNDFNFGALIVSLFVSGFHSGMKRKYLNKVINQNLYLLKHHSQKEMKLPAQSIRQKKNSMQLLLSTAVNLKNYQNLFLEICHH